jgi:transposase
MAIPYLTEAKALELQAAANATVASFTGATAAALVRCLAKQLQQSLAAETELKERMSTVYARLPQANHLDTIPGIGVATAAVLTAKIVAIERFATDAHLVSYFGVFPEEYQSGLAKDGTAKPGRRGRMSRKGYDLARKYLWNAAKAAIRHNPAVRPLYARLRSRGTRGDVALGHARPGPNSKGHRARLRLRKPRHAKKSLAGSSSASVGGGVPYLTRIHEDEWSVDCHRRLRPDVRSARWCRATP